MVLTTKKRSTHFKVTLVLMAIGGSALLVAAIAVPQGPEDVINLYDRGLEGGPDSYFHHFYDPNHLLGPVGHVDLDLDNFKTSTGNIIIFAALDMMPSKDPLFTLYTAEKWARGQKVTTAGWLCLYS